MFKSTEIASIVSGVCLIGFGNSAQAVVVEAQAVRDAAGSIELTWVSSDPTLPVDVYAVERPDAPASRRALLASGVAENRYVIASGPRRMHYLLRQADGSTYRVAERTMPLQGASNFRDIGGYGTTDGRHVKWGMIYRSSALSALTRQDYNQLRRLNLTTVYDLRSSDEQRSEPTTWQGGRAPALRGQAYDMDMRAFMSGFRTGFTVDNAHAVMTQFYPQLIDSHRRQFTDVFRELKGMRGTNALLFHCTAGKDRTGAQTALILTALGVPRDTILADFELSNRYYKPKPAAPAAAGGAQNPMAQLPPDVMAVLMGVDRRYLVAFFEAVEAKHGTIQAYLDKELGVTADDLVALRARYTY